MPEVREITAEFTARGSGLPRSKGVHLSDVYNAMYRDLWMDGKPDTARTAQDYMLMESGFLWEDVFSRAWAAREVEATNRGADYGVLFRPAEEVVTGIYCSPDGVRVTPTGDSLLEEYKFTRTSSKKAPLDNWRWSVQIPGYLHALSLTVCRLHVFHINGDYKRGNGGGPEYKQWELTYTADEISTNWDMVTKYARDKEWIE